MLPSGRSCPSPFGLRLPPSASWEVDRLERPVLQACASAFSRWICGPVYSRRNTRASKFESRVLEILGAFFGPDKTVVREVVLPVRVDHRLRRLMDDLQAGDFQLSSTIELRIDFAYLDEGIPEGAKADGSPALCLIEVDGSQHGSTSHFFHGLAAGKSTLPRALRRDMLKDAIVSAAGVRMLRLGPDCERDTHQAKLLILKRLAAFSTGTAPSPGAHKILKPTAPASAAVPFAPLGVNRAAFTLFGVSPSLAFATWAESKEREEKVISRGKPELQPAPTARRRSRSAPRILCRAARRDPFVAQLSEETQRKLRTAYNRRCKELGQAAELHARIAQRQLANDSRKRPRDDTGMVYEPKWFKSARRWYLEQTRAASST